MSDLAPKCEHCRYPFVVDDELTCHEYWETATREELLETLKFQGATSRLMKDDYVKGYNAGLKRAIEIVYEHVEYSVIKVLNKARLKVVKKFLPNET